MKKILKPLTYVAAVILGAMIYIMLAAVQDAVDKSRKWTLEDIMRREG